MGKTRLCLALCAVSLCVLIGCSAGGSTTGPSSQPTGSQSTPLQVVTSQLPDATSNAPYSAQLDARGGTPPYIWTPSGTLPVGMTMSSTGTIAGTPAAPGQSDLNVAVQDSEKPPQTADATVVLDVASGTTANAVETSAPVSTPTSNYYGAGIGGDALANTTIGPHGETVSYRFVAEHASALAKIRVYLIPDHVGYAGGTGGELEISVETDDGTTAHNPSGTKLASAVIENPLAATGVARYFPLVTFASPPTLSAGKIYHIVFTNVDSDPSINYLSVDDLWYAHPTSPDQPTVSDVASAVLMRWDGGSWGLRKGYSPIMELYYSNGDYQGCGYVEAFVMAPQEISGAHAVRETFTVTHSDKTVSTVGLRVARASGSGNLTVRLENVDGSLIEEGYLSASSFPLTSPVSHVWALFRFSDAHTLVAGKTYHLDLEASSSTEYLAYPMQKGTAYGFDKLTYFPDGYAQFKQGTSWVGWSVWGATNRTDSDLQFFFGLE